MVAGIKSRTWRRRLGSQTWILLTLIFITIPASAQCQEAPEQNAVQDAQTLPAGIKIDRTPQGPEEWRSATILDLGAIHDLVATQTPVPFDELNPSYRQWLEEGYRIGLARAQQMSGPYVYADILGAYVNGFDDPHFFLKTYMQAHPPHWPGFIVSPQGSTPVITYRDPTNPSLPELGTILKACDGQDINSLVAARVFPIRFDQRTALGQRRAVSNLFLDFGGLIQMPKTCDFQVGAVTISRQLNWATIPNPSDVFWSQFQDASSGPPAQFGLSFPVDGVAWIGLPTFFDDASTESKLRALLQQLSASASKMRAGRAIVIDIRGNAGGSLEWADAFASAIFTWPVVRATAPNGLATSTDWRVSAENLQFVRGLQQTSRVQRVVSELNGAKRRAVPIWREGPKRTRETSGLTTRRPTLSRQRPFPARIYVLSDGTCISACLYFADLVLQIPGTRLIGSETGGDTGYTSVRHEVLPSGLTQFWFPMTYVHKRGRGPMEFYAADVVYNGPRDDASMRRWTLNLIIHETNKTR